MPPRRLHYRFSPESKIEMLNHDLAGLLACSLLSTFPSMNQKFHQQWLENSTVVNRQSSVVSFSHDARLTIHAKNLQLRG
jgi:hypothetical protein